MNKVNGGGRNGFYDIPEEVNNVDSLAKFLKASGPVFNILKSLFGLRKNRHTGTSSVRDSEKIIHYGIENYIWQEDTKENTHSDVIYKLITELEEKDRVRLLGRLESLKEISKITEKDSDVLLCGNAIKPTMKVHGRVSVSNPSNYGTVHDTMLDSKSDMVSTTNNH